MSRITRTQPSVSHAANVTAETAHAHAAHDGSQCATGSAHADSRAPASRPTPRRLTAGNLAARRAYARAQAKKLAAARKRGRKGARGVSDDEFDGGVDDSGGSGANAPIEGHGGSQDDKGGGQGDQGHSQEHHEASAKSRKTNPNRGQACDGAYANRRFLTGVLAVLKEHPADAAARFLQLTLERLRAGGVPSSGGLKGVAQQLATYRPAPSAAPDPYVDGAVVLPEPSVDEADVVGKLVRERDLNILAPLVLLNAQRRYSEDGRDTAIATLIVLLQASELARRRAADPSR